MAKTVSPIFGGEAKVKLMRLFIFNPDSIYNVGTLTERIRERPKATRKELNQLSKAGLVNKRARGFVLNDEYPYLDALRDFLINATPLSEKEIIKRLNRAGNLKMVLVSGVFTHAKESRVDLLVVGDKLKPGQLVSAIARIEAELGTEIRYAAFETADFKYRLGIYDKLIRDILDYPHKKILNKIGL